MCFRADRKTNVAPKPLFGWNVFDFFSATTQWNSTKLHRKQNLNVLYQVDLFWLMRKLRWLPWLLISLDIYFGFPLTMEWNLTKTWWEASTQHHLPSLCYSSRLENQDDRPILWLVKIFFYFSSATIEQNSTKIHRKQGINILYQVSAFQADQKTKMTILASKWLRHFLEKLTSLPSLWLVKTFSKLDRRQVLFIIH